jgi:hypothetical protein
MSTSPCSSIERCSGASDTWRMTTRFICAGGVRAPGTASSDTDSLSCQALSLNGPEPALCVFSQSLPRSPFTWCAITAFFSTIEATPDARQSSTNSGE